MNTPSALRQPNPVLDGLEAASERIETEHDGRKISWRIWGQGRPVVFLHGGSGSWKHWVHQLDAFRGDYQLIAPDLPGYGLSDDPEYPIDFMAIGRDVAAGIDAIIGPETHYIVVPFSFGGSITSQLVQLHRDRLDGLILCSAAGFMPPSPPPMLKVRDKEGDELTATHRTNLGSIMLADPARIDALALRIQHENSMQSRLRAMYLDRGKMLHEVLPGFPAPVVAIWGDRDAFMAPGSLEKRRARLLGALPEAQVKILNGAGHWIAYEAKDQVNAIIAESLTAIWGVPNNAEMTAEARDR